MGLFARTGREGLLFLKKKKQKNLIRSAFRALHRWGATLSFRVGCASSHPKPLKGGCFFASFFTKKEVLACCHA